MKSLFEYESYRLFLADWFQEMKTKRRNFSYRSFALKAGFRSCGFCHQVVNGERSLTSEATGKMLVGLGLTGKKAQFFEALVRFEQARTTGDKQRAFSEMNFIRKDSAFFRMNRSHIRYFEHWWYPVLRNLVVSAPWGNDFALLGSLIEPPIGESMAREGVALLQDLDLIDCDDQGNWHLTATLISSSDVPPLVKMQARADMLHLGIAALDKFPSNQRHATYYTLAMGAESYQKVISLIDELNSQASSLAADDSHVERIYELAVLLYPLSKVIEASP